MPYMRDSTGRRLDSFAVLAADGLPLSRTAARIAQGLPIKVVAVGDSIPEGTTVSSGGGVLGVDDFLSLVATSIDARTTGAVTKSNRAVSGRTAGTGFFYGDVNSAISDAGHLYLIAYGHNDLRSDSQTPGTGYPKAAMARTMEKLIRRIRDEVPAADIIIVLENPYTSGSGSNALLEGQNVLLRPLAAFYGCAVADTYASFLALGNYEGLLSDGAHPNKAGHALIAETILDLIPTAGAPVAPPVPDGDLYGAARMGRTWVTKAAVESGATITDSVRYVLSGTWDSTSTAPHTSSTAASFFRLHTYGDEVSIQLDCGPGQGVVTITVDSQVNKYTIDLSTYSSGQRFIPLTGLGNGGHIIVVTLSSGSMTFRGASAPARTGYSLDLANTTKVARTGTWALNASLSSSPSGWQLQSSTVGDSLQVTLYGTGLALLHNRFSSNQQIEVQIDGGAWVSKEVSTPIVGGAAAPSVVVTGLPLGRHIIGLRVAGVRSMNVYDITALDETATGYRRDTDMSLALRSALA